MDSEAARQAGHVNAVHLGVVLIATLAFHFPKVVLRLPTQVIPESVGCFKNPSGSGHICAP